MRNSGKGGEEGAGAGGRTADSSDTEVIEGTGTGGPGQVTRAAAAAVAVVTCLCGAAGGVLGSRYVPSLLDRSEVSVGEDVLHVHSEWPLSPCSAVALAGLPGAPAPTAYDGTQRPFGTAELSTLAPPIAYRRGWLVLTLSGTGSGTLLIDDVDVQVFREDEDVTPEWALLEGAGGCGPSTRWWLMDVVLAAGQGELVHRGPSRVSRTDPAEVHVHVSSCDRYYEFGLVISYTVDGEDRVARVGSEEQPFRVVGGAARALYTSSGSPGPDQVRLGDDLLFPSCT
jgi:hypothetical protein